MFFSYRSFYANIPIMLIRGTPRIASEWLRWSHYKVCLIIIRSFSRSWLTPCVETRVKRRVSLLARNYVPFGKTRVHLVCCMPPVVLFWPLHCLSFFEIRLLITHLAYSNFFNQILNKMISIYLRSKDLRLYLQYVSYAYYTAVKYMASVIHFIKISETFHKMFKYH